MHFDWRVARRQPFVGISPVKARVCLPIMAFSRMNLPSLYFWLSSYALSRGSGQKFEISWMSVSYIRALESPQRG